MESPYKKPVEQQNKMMKIEERDKNTKYTSFKN